MRNWLLLLLVIPMLALTACDGDKNTDKGQRDDTPADIVNFPRGWSNVAHKCDGPNMVYVSDHGDSSGSSVAVVPNDPRCPNASP